MLEGWPQEAFFLLQRRASLQAFPLSRRPSEVDINHSIQLKHGLGIYFSLTENMKVEQHFFTKPMFFSLTTT